MALSSGVYSMDKQQLIELFVEDRAHELFIGAVVERIALESNKSIDLRIRSARGGHGRALDELGLYQNRVWRQGSNELFPDLVVVAIDANCQGFHAARKQIEANLDEKFRPITAIACPDPHIERWYFADVVAFAQAVGQAPTLGKEKCERDKYKRLLAKSVSDAGKISLLGGIDFAREIVEIIDWYRAGKAVASFKAFCEDLRLFFNKIQF
jgi:hypothetical protein